MKKVTFALSSLTIAAAGIALAQAPATGPANPSNMAGHSQFSALDTNKDGRISKDEIKSNADLTSSFSSLDTDHDSYLSESEYGKWKAASAPSKMAPADSTKPSAPSDAGGKY